LIVLLRLHVLVGFIRFAASLPNSINSDILVFSLVAWMKERGFKIEYMEVNADHGGMIPLVLPSVFYFFDRCRPK
jgi:hypothetical protein